MRNTDLSEKFTRLVLKKTKPDLSEDQLRNITDKYADKTLHELHKITLELIPLTTKC